MGEASPIQIAEVIGNFQYNGRLMRGCAYGNGHINDTYLLTFQISGMGNIKVILQKMNSVVSLAIFFGANFIADTLMSMDLSVYALRV